MVFTLNKIGELHFRLLGTNGYRVKAKIERFTAASFLSRRNLIINMKNCVEKIALELKRAARATGLIFLIQPINCKSLICGVVVFNSLMKVLHVQPQRHKSIIWLIEWGTIIVLHVQHALKNTFFRSVANNKAKNSICGCVDDNGNPRQ